MKSKKPIKLKCKCGRGFWTKIYDRTLCHKCNNENKKKFYYSKFRFTKEPRKCKEEFVVKGKSVWGN